MASRAVLAALLLMLMGAGAWVTYVAASLVSVGYLASTSESGTRNATRPPASLVDPVAAYRERFILVQEELRVRGYRPGPVDGVFRPQTAVSLRAFQRDEGLEITGRATAQTLERLGIEVPPTRLKRRPSASPVGLVASIAQAPALARQPEE